MKKLSVLAIAAVILASAATYAAIARQSAYDALLKALTTSAHARSFTADVTITITQDGTTVKQVGTIRCLKPSSIRFDLWAVPGPRTADTPHMVVVSDGKKYWRITGQGAIDNGNAPQSANDLDNYGLAQAFFMTGSPLPAELKTECKWAGTETLNGATYRVVAMPYPGGGVNLFDIGADGCIHRIFANGNGMSADLVFSHVHLDGTLTASDFQFTPPSDRTAWTMPKADAKSRAIIERVTNKLQSVQSLTAEYDESLHISAGQGKPRIAGWTAAIRLAKPNFLDVNITQGTNGDGDTDTALDKSVHQVSDGSDYWEVEADKTYTKTPASSSGHDLRIAIFEQELGAFFDPTQNIYAVDNEQADVHSVKFAGVQTWQGAPYDVIVFQLDPGQGAKETDTVYVGSDDLIHRLSSLITSDQGTLTAEDTLAKIDTSTQLAKADFAFVPPAGATQRSADEDSDGDGNSDNGPPVIGNDMVAPNFTARDAAGKPIRLSDFRGKVVVLDMWATWCGPCQISLPSTNDIARQYRDKGVVVLALNVMDSTDAFKAWLPSHKKLDALTFAVDPSGQDADVPSLYQVSAIPTQFVIGRDGKIVKSFVGFSGSDDDLAQAIDAALAAGRASSDADPVPVVNPATP